MRRAVRDALVERHILERMVRDIRWLLAPEDSQSEEEEVVYLWDNTIGQVASATNYCHTSSQAEDTRF